MYRPDGHKCNNERPEPAMTVLCRRISKYEYFLVATDAVADNENLTLKIVKSSLKQKEQKNMARFDSSNKNIDLA